MLSNEDWEAVAADQAMTIVMLNAEIDMLKERLEESSERILYDAWRDSEAYQVPMTEEGDKLAGQRFRGFKLGWLYAQFYALKGNIYMKDSMDYDGYGEE